MTSFAARPTSFRLASRTATRAPRIPTSGRTAVPSRLGCPGSCIRGDECTNGRCEDGICCDRTCAANERCRAELKVSGEDGVCGPAKAAAPGAPCRFDVQCTSGHCSGPDGVCADADAVPDGACTSGDACVSGAEPSVPGDGGGCGCCAGSPPASRHAWLGVVLVLLLLRRSVRRHTLGGALSAGATQLAWPDSRSVPRTGVMAIPRIGEAGRLPRSRQRERWAAAMSSPRRRIVLVLMFAGVGFGGCIGGGSARGGGLAGDGGVAVGGNGGGVASDNPLLPARVRRLTNAEYAGSVFALLGVSADVLDEEGEVEQRVRRWPSCYVVRSSTALGELRYAMATWKNGDRLMSRWRIIGDQLFERDVGMAVGASAVTHTRVSSSRNQDSPKRPGGAPDIDKAADEPLEQAVVRPATGVPIRIRPARYIDGAACQTPPGTP